MVVGGIDWELAQGSLGHSLGDSMRLNPGQTPVLNGLLTKLPTVLPKNAFSLTEYYEYILNYKSIVNIAQLDLEVTFFEFFNFAETMIV